MAHNQSRAERTESSQYRKSGRSNYHRNFSGGGTKGTSGTGGSTKGTSGTGGAATGPPPPSTTNNTSSFNNSNSQPSLSSNRSFKKHNNVQGGISRASAAPSSQAVNSDCSTHSAPRAVQNGAHAQQPFHVYWRAVQNGAHAQQPFHGASDAPPTTATVKPTDVASPKATRAPRAPSPKVPSVTSDSKHPPVPVTPAKAPADASWSFPLQFGSMSPGLMNGMQIPTRTSSAPPNLDEQKRDQARHDSLRAPPAMPIPSIPKQQLPKEVSKKKKKKSCVRRQVELISLMLLRVILYPNLKGMHKLQQFPLHLRHRNRLCILFQGCLCKCHSTSHRFLFNLVAQIHRFSHKQCLLHHCRCRCQCQCPYKLEVQLSSSQFFFSGLQPHPMQSQGIPHQGQTLTFTSHMGLQIPQQLGNIGINIAPQYPQQQAGKFGGPRKAVKIIHPETQEELRLDGSPAPRSHTNVAPQSQPISSFPPAHPANYYPNSYNANSLVFPPPSSIPLNTSPPPSQPPRYYNQARHDSLRALPAMPIPSIPRQQLPREAGRVDQANAAESHPIPKPKRDAQVSAVPATSQTQKPSVHPIPGLPMQMPFHQPQVPVQFGGPNPQIQSQAMSSASLPMPMPMPMPMPLQIGSPAVQQPVFVSGLQPHPMQSQGILHQGQNLTFTSHMGPQIPQQLGNIGINIAPQYPQQQAVKFGGPRIAVKITHPETHEELRLDGSPAPRSHTNVAPQSQPISSFPPAHPANYYRNSYNANSLVFPPPSSLPLNTSHPPSQPPRYYNQVTVKPAASSHGEKDPASLVSSPRAPKGESLKPSRPSQKDAEASSQSSVQQSKPGLGPTSRSMPEASKSSVQLGSDSVRNPTPISLSTVSLVPVEKPASANVRGEGLGLEISGGLDFVKDQQKKVDGQPTSILVLSPHEPEIVGVKTTDSSASSVVLGNSKKTVSTATVVESDACDLKHEQSEESKASESSTVCVARTVEDNQSKAETLGKRDQGEEMSGEDSKRDNKGLETSLESSALEPVTSQNIERSAVKGTTSGSGLSLQEPLGSMQRQLKESGALCIENDQGTDYILTRSSIPDTGKDGMIPSTVGVTKDDKISFDSSLGRPDRIDTEDSVTSSAVAEKEPIPDIVPISEENLKHKDDDTEDNNAGSVSSSASGIKEKSLPEPSVAKGTVPKGKKKRKELFKKLDSSGPTSDLYLAYKGPEEKKETVISAGITESTSNSNLEPISLDVSQKDVPKEKAGQGKVEPDDWEDATDISTPKLETSENRKQVDESGEDGNGVLTKKYSRDFLLKFAEQCTDIPEGFAIAPDLVEPLIASNRVSRESYLSSGRMVDRPNMAARLDRRGSGLGEEDKWNKLHAPLMSGRDMRMDIYGPNMVMFRPDQVGNHGAIRNPRMQTPAQFPGSILPGQMRTLVPQIVVPRNSSDSDRWQRGTAFQKGLMPSPQTPLQIMHKADRKYEIGKVTDEEESKQRQLKAILNKLTPQNFEKLFVQVKQVNIDTAVTLTGVISQIFDKALMEPTFCEMYANFCYHLAAELPDLSVDNEKITFKRLLLNKCQEEFERGEREQEEANKADEEGEAKQSAHEREQKRLRARRKMLGNIRLIGELYKKRMLTERIMHECIKKLLGQYQNPDEEDIEALCKLMSTIGEMIDHPKAKEHMDVYFDMMEKLSSNMKLSSRVRFMLKDAIDLRKNKWQQRRKVEGPKKIEEVHRDAAHERQAQARGLARAPSMGSSVRRGQPFDFSPRGSNVLSSPSSQMGGFRALAPQLRGYGAQDVRIEERHTLENRTLSVPLPQRPLGDDSITLGPQGGLARGMSFRGQSASPGIPLSDVPSSGDSRRVGPGLNGYSPTPDRTAYAAREDPMQRNIPDRFVGASSYDQSSSQERNMTYGNTDIRSTDRGFDRSLPMSPPARGGGAFTQTVSSEKVWPEERLRDMSISAIKEFYSANDENEVALCIKDLNNPSFYPSMISLWVNDSFERKDMERGLLAKLLVNLTKYRDGIISQDQLIKGFESVLMTLEDAVNDAPRAAEFLGRIFGKVILENVIPFNEIGRLIYEGGEEQGRLVEIGLAAEVLGTILEMVTSERGDSVLTEIRSSSNLRLENFRPPSSNKSWRLEKFI